MNCVIYEDPFEKQPVLEMNTIEGLEELVVSKEKLQLPNGSAMNHFVCFLNTDLTDIATVLNNKHRLLLNKGNLYRAYYYDALRLRRAIQSRRVKNIGKSKAELRTDRKARYSTLKAMTKVITPFDVSALVGKNFVYDMEPLTDVLKLQENLRKVPLTERLRLYFDSISTMYDDLEFVGYERGPIFISMDGYDPSAKLDRFLFYDYMMILLNKSENFISRSLSDLPDFDLLFYTSKGYLLLHKNDIKRINRSRIANLMRRLKPNVASAETKFDTIVQNDYDAQIGMRLNLTGPESSFKEDAVPSEAGKKVEQKKATLVKDVKDEEEAEKIIQAIDANDDDDEEAIKAVAHEIENDEKLKLDYIKSVTAKKTNVKSDASLKRDKLLRERQMQLKIRDKTIGELVADMPTPPPIQETKINTTVTDNEELKTVRFYNFEKTYQEEMYDRDIARALTCFNDKSINVNILKVKVEDTSTEMVYQDTYTVEYEDEYRRRWTMKVNIPKLIDDKFLIINGKKRIIYKQLAGLPVIKTGPDEVQICTNYNKLWLMRHGTRFNPNMERFKKIIKSPNDYDIGVPITVYRGSNLIPNEPYATCLEYDELAARYNKIIIGDCTFVFSIAMLKEELGAAYKDSTLQEIIIGYRGTKKTPIVYHTSSELHQDMVSFIIEQAAPNYQEEFKHMSSGRKYLHTVVKIMEKLVPLVFIVTYFEGVTTVIKKFNDLLGEQIVTLVDKKSKDDVDYNMYIQFADAYIKYPMNCIEACLLFNGYTDLIMKEYTIAELDERDTYISIFDVLLGSGYLAGGFINYYDFMIDPKTLDILKLLHYPEDIVSLMIFASNLLADGSYLLDVDPAMYRLRNAEIIPAILYREMCTSYASYRKTAGNANPKKPTVDPDCVIKQLSKLPTVESYSTLSPIKEVEQFGVASMKGYKGMNKDRSYNEGKRTYHDNMVGLIGLSTDIAANAGKERHMVVEPNVVNAYGMFEVHGRENMNELNFTQLMTAEEALYPMGLSHDDPNRTAMASKQSCHAIPVKDQCPLLITNGFDGTIQYRTSNDFSYVAKQDGKVIDKDDKLNIMVVQYKDGTIAAIDLDQKVVQNGGGGMYLDNKLDTTFRKGDTFKKDAILAFDRHYFKDTGVLGNKLTYGTLVKVASIQNFATYEDSMWSTYRVARALSADITMKEVSVVLGKNSNVDYIAKVGDRVINGEDLIRFDTAYNDAEMNKLLGTIRSDLQEEIINLGKTKYTSKHDGVVADIRVYPAVELSELSPSLRKVVNDIQKHDRDRRKFMDKYDSNKDSVYRSGIFFDRPTGVVKPDQYGKIGGDDVGDGVKIEIYVMHHDEVSDGDKFAHMSANKATNGFMVPRGFEPYTARRPYEEIDIPDAPSAILQRGTPSVNIITSGYNVIVELKRSLYELLTGLDWNEKQRKERPYMDVHGDHIKPVKESTVSGFSEFDLQRAEEKISTLESVFNVGKSSDGCYEAAMEYSVGDIVFAGMNFKRDLNRAVFEQHLASSEDGYAPNIKLDETVGAYIATDMIYYGERFIL